MNSCLYEGTVAHRRFGPVDHAFEFPLFLVYLDLDELATVFRGRWLWSTRRPAPARFRREDHLGSPRVPLADAVRDLVAARGGERPQGPVRLLTHLRYFGYGFNPVSFYYCFAPGGSRVEAVVAEVRNTPWNERHCYVLRLGDAPQRGEGEAHQGAPLVTPKVFHVSPFMGMDQSYGWSLGEPGERLRVGIESRDREGRRVFAAGLALRRVEIGGWSLARALCRYPVMTAQVIAAIYWQALRLRRKGVPQHPHPREAESRREATA